MFRHKDVKRKLGDPKPVPKKKEKKGLQRKFNPIGEGELFKKLFAERPHVSFITGEPIYNIDHSNCAHVLRKAKNGYPLFKLYEKNIVFLSLDEHFMFDNMAPSELKLLPEFEKLLKLKEELLTEYKKNKTMKTYDVNYFIKKFEAIPEKKWAIGNFKKTKFRLFGKFFPEHSYCANGLCGAYALNQAPVVTEEAKALQEVFSVLTPLVKSCDKGQIGKVHWELEEVMNYSLTAAWINNGFCSYYNQPTPKQRIMVALYDIKRMQEEEEKINYRTILVEVDEKVKQLTEVEFNN